MGGVAIDLSGRVALVTGASGGIGAGIAAVFAAAGATVAVHFRSDAEGAEAVVSRLTDAFTVGGDLTAADGPRSVTEAVLARAGRIDVLVNNAGIQPLAELATVTEEEWRAMIEVNVTAVHRLTQAVAAEMTEGGSIIHIASIEGSRPAHHHGHYAVAKAALIMHARAAAIEWGPRRIRVNSVSPGLIDRPGLAEAWPEGVRRWRAAAPLGRLGTPTDVGGACLFLASDLASWITGVDLVVDGGVSVPPAW